VVEYFNEKEFSIIQDMQKCVEVCNDPFEDQKIEIKIKSQFFYRLNPSSEIWKWNKHFSNLAHVWEFLTV
jgi:hypothetical protein